MATNSSPKQLVESISFEVEATANEVTSESENAGNMTPVNVKVRVRKKDDGKAKVRQGVIAIPQSDGTPERLRLTSSDQTILSFNVLMEAEFEKKIKRKNKRNIFGLCLGAQSEEDDSQYLPASSEKGGVSRSDSGMLKKKVLVVPKNISNLHTSEPLKKKEKTFFGKCKPGGCLDPPFGEDKYAYEPPPKTTQPASTISELDNIHCVPCHTHEKDKEKGKIERPIDKDPTVSSWAKLRNKTDRPDSSTFSVYNGESNYTMRGDDTESIITYPPTLSSSGNLCDDERSEKSKKIAATRQSRLPSNEFNTIYYSPPKKASRESKENKKAILTSDSIPDVGKANKVSQQHSLATPVISIVRSESKSQNNEDKAQQPNDPEFVNIRSGQEEIHFDRKKALRTAYQEEDVLIEDDNKLKPRASITPADLSAILDDLDTKQKKDIQKNRDGKKPSTTSVSAKSPLPSEKCTSFERMENDAGLRLLDVVVKTTKSPTKNIKGDEFKDQEQENYPTMIKDLSYERNVSPVDSKDPIEDKNIYIQEDVQATKNAPYTKKEQTFPTTTPVKQLSNRAGQEILRKDQAAIHTKTNIKDFEPSSEKEFSGPDQIPFEAKGTAKVQLVSDKDGAEYMSTEVTYLTSQLKEHTTNADFTDKTSSPLAPNAEDSDQISKSEFLDDNKSENLKDDQIIQPLNKKGGKSIKMSSNQKELQKPDDISPANLADRRSSNIPFNSNEASLKLAEEELMKGRRRSLIQNSLQTKPSERSASDSNKILSGKRQSVTSKVGDKLSLDQKANYVTSSAKESRPISDAEILENEDKVSDRKLRSAITSRTGDDFSEASLTTPKDIKLPLPNDKILDEQDPTLRAKDFHQTGSSKAEFISAAETSNDLKSTDRTIPSKIKDMHKSQEFMPLDPKKVTGKIQDSTSTKRRDKTQTHESSEQLGAVEPVDDEKQSEHERYPDNQIYEQDGQSSDYEKQIEYEISIHQLGDDNSRFANDINFDVTISELARDEKIKTEAMIEKAEQNSLSRSLIVEIDIPPKETVRHVDHKLDEYISPHSDSPKTNLEPVSEHFTNNKEKNGDFQSSTGTIEGSQSTTAVAAAETNGFLLDNLHTKAAAADTDEFALDKLHTKIAAAETEELPLDKLHTKISAADLDGYPLDKLHTKGTSVDTEESSLDKLRTKTSAAETEEFSSDKLHTKAATPDTEEFPLDKLHTNTSAADTEEFSIDKFHTKAATTETEEFPLDKLHTKTSAADTEEFSVDKFHTKAAAAETEEFSLDKLRTEAVTADTEEFSLDKLHTKAATEDTEEFSSDKFHTKAATTDIEEFSSDTLHTKTSAADTEEFAIDKFHTKAATADIEEFSLDKLHTKTSAADTEKFSIDKVHTKASTADTEEFSLDKLHSKTSAADAEELLLDKLHTKAATTDTEEFSLDKLHTEVVAADTEEFSFDKLHTKAATGDTEEFPSDKFYTKAATADTEEFPFDKIHNKAVIADTEEFSSDKFYTKAATADTEEFSSDKFHTKAATADTEEFPLDKLPTEAVTTDTEEFFLDKLHTKAATGDTEEFPLDELPNEEVTIDTEEFSSDQFYIKAATAEPDELLLDKLHNKAVTADTDEFLLDKLHTKVVTGDTEEFSSDKFHTKAATADTEEFPLDKLPTEAVTTDTEEFFLDKLHTKAATGDTEEFPLDELPNEEVTIDTEEFSSDQFYIKAATAEPDELLLDKLHNKAVTADTDEFLLDKLHTKVVTGDTEEFSLDKLPTEAVTADTDEFSLDTLHAKISAAETEEFPLDTKTTAADTEDFSIDTLHTKISAAETEKFPLDKLHTKAAAADTEENLVNKLHTKASATDTRDIFLDNLHSKGAAADPKENLSDKLHTKASATDTEEFSLNKLHNKTTAAETDKFPLYEGHISEISNILSDDSHQIGDREKNKQPKDTVFLDLAFQAELVDDQTVIKTLDSTAVGPDTNNVSLVKSLVNYPDKPVIVPINDACTLNITIKSQTVNKPGQIPKSIAKFDSGVSTIGHGSISGVSLEGSRLHTTISAIYDQDLVPLQQVIKNLKHDIDDLATKQLLLREIVSRKRLRHIKTTHNLNNRRSGYNCCGCRK